MGRVGDQAMRSCLCLLLALLTTTALGSWQYHLGEESDSCDDEDFLFDEEEIEEKEESSIARVSKRGKSWGENTILKPRWTPEATVLRLLRLCQPTATLSAVYNKSAAKSQKHMKTLLLRCLLERNLLDENRQQKKIVNKKTQFLRFGRG